MKYWIPNCVTLLNLVFGMLSIFATLRGDYYISAWCIVLAMVADGMDGRVARYFNVSSEMGKELDSLCDLASFGVAPGVLAYSFLLEDAGAAGAFAAIFFAACGAFRLARFNVNASVVKGYFMGLPIPAGGCLVATFVMIGVRPESWIFSLMVFIFGYLMVSKVHYPDFKGKGEKLRVFPAVIAAALGVLLLYYSMQAVFFVPFICYAVFGVLNTALAFAAGK